MLQKFTLSVIHDFVSRGNNYTFMYISTITLGEHDYETLSQRNATDI